MNKQERLHEAGRQHMGAFERGISERSPLRDITRWGTREWRAERHADWFCSLPWYARWWAMVRGR